MVGAQWPVEDAIEVAAAAGREAGVEIHARHHAVENPDRRGRQMGIHRLRYHPSSPGLGEIEVDHLAGCVDPRIGAAGGVDADARR